MTHVGEQRLLQYVLDELDARRAAEVERHLDGCEACRQRVAAERALDEAVILTGASAPAGAAERSLERLWASLDAEGQGPAAAPSPVATERPAATRAASFAAGPWLSAAALLLVALTLVLLSGGNEDPGATTPADERPTARGDAPTGASAATTDEPTSTGPAVVADVASGVGAPPVPARLPGDPVDARRLADQRQALADALARLDQEGAAPLTGQALRDAAEPLLASLRRDGWPVPSLLRSLALEGDAAVAAVVLRLAHADPGLDGVLAASLAQRPGPALALLEQDDRPLARSASLRRAVERLADPRPAGPEAQGAEATGGRARRLLAAQRDPAGRTATARLLERALDRARSADGPLQPLLDLAAGAPLDLALATLLEAGRELPLREACRDLFHQRVAADRAGAEALLLARLEDRHQVDPLLSFCVGTGLEGLARPLLARLEDDPDDAGVLATLVDLGGVEVAEGLALLAREHDARDARRLVDGLRLVLDEQPALVPALARRLGRQGSEPLVALAEDLPADQRGALLREGLELWLDDRGGHGAALLAALARLGTAADGPALLARLPALAASGGLAPLAWTAAARLDEPAALSAYAAAGGDPERLAGVSRQTRGRLAAGRLPSRRLLDPLAQDLARLATP